MKILYTADDRHDAQLAASAVHGLAPDVKVTWAGRLSDAGQWLSENRDLAAIVIDAEVQSQSCAPLVRHVRSLGLATPIFVVVPETAMLPAAVIEAGADEFVVRNQSLFSDLAARISRARRRQQTEQRFYAALSARVRLHDALAKQLNDATQTRQKLEARLADALTLLQRRDADVETTLARLRTRDAELTEGDEARRGLEQRRAEVEEALRRQIATGEALDQELTTVRVELAHAGAKLQEAEARHVSALTSAAEAERQAMLRQTELESAVSQDVARRHVVERELEEAHRTLAERDTASRDADERYSSELEAHAAAHAALEQNISNLAQQHAAFVDAADARLADQQREHETRRALLEAELVDLRTAGQRAAAERLETEQQAALRAAESEERHASELNSAAEARAALEEHLSNLAQQHAASVEAADARLADQQREHETRQALLEAELVDLRTAGQRAAAERLETEQQAALRAAESEERHASELNSAAEARAALEGHLSNLAQQHAASVEAADARLADQQREHETRQALLEAELVDLRTAGQRAAAERLETEQQAALRAAESEERHASELNSAAEARAALEQHLSNLAQQHAAFVEAAAAQLAEQRWEHEAGLAEQTAARAAVDQQLRDTEATLVRIQRESASIASTASERLSRRESELAAVSAARLAVEQRLVEAETALEHVSEQALVERAAAFTQAARQQAESDARLAREVDARVTLERELVETRTAVQEQLGNLSNVVNQVHADAAQAVERLTSDHAALESELRTALADRNQRVDELNGELQALGRELTAARNHRDALQLEAHRAPELARQLADSRAENRRQFERSPVNILRCRRDGALEKANHTLISTLGYRSLDELRALDFPASIFESADDLHWLIQRSQTGPRQPADCNLRKKDGSRLSVRLHAVPVSADIIEIVAEDLTSLRAVEDRLSKAHRMEAVGRLASEVADTCDNLLRNVTRSGDELLASLGDTPLRSHGEVIFADVTSAASFLRQLSAYSHKQAQAGLPADVSQVLRDLEPVLKRVAGDDIELVLPKKASALTVDVDAERVERVLVNLAAYGRSRLPSGGRLIVELARVAVDRKFVTKYPNVREGGHALIRITELKTTGRTMWPIGLRDVHPARASQLATDRPGVDLGALQTLIGDCGGHLWMNAEPGGNMEVKIRLPLRPGERLPHTARSTSGRAMARWFHS